MKKLFTKKAFTLYELLLAMFLTLMVSGIVISFIVATSNFNTKTNKTNDLMQTEIAFRSEVDRWFSVFDTTEYTITIMPSQYGNNVRATNGVDTYEIVIYGEVVEGVSVVKANFTYTESNFHPNFVTIELKQISSVYFFKEGDIITANDHEILNFVINQSVTNKLYRCSLISVS